MTGSHKLSFVLSMLAKSPKGLPETGATGALVGPKWLCGPRRPAGPLVAAGTSRAVTGPMSEQRRGTGH